MRRLCALIAFAALAACTTPNASKSVAFSAGSQSALIAVAVRLPHAHLASYVVNVTRVDNGPNAAKLRIGDDMVTNFSQTFVRRHVVEVQPGTYRIERVAYESGRTNYVICISRGATDFTLKAGEAVYLGEFELRPYGAGGTLGYALDGIAEAQDALAKEYPNVTAKLTAVNLTPQMAALGSGGSECR